MVFHWWLVSPPAWNFIAHGVRPEQDFTFLLLAKTPANLVLGGATLVLVFFVMSGAVLALTFTEVDKKRFVPYALKRFCRIYVPYAFTVILSLIVMNMVRPAPVETLSVWFNTFSWSQAITPLTFVNYVLMTNHDTTLDPVVWSLAHELRISLVFPLLLFFVVRWQVAALIGITALSVAAEVILGWFHVHWIIGEVLASIKYCYLFAFGAALYLNPVELTARGASPKTRSVVLWVIAMVPVFVSVQISPLLECTSAFLISSTAAILIVALALSANAVSHRVLASGWAVWLGKLSYSLYLIHIPILLVVLHLFYGDAPILVLFVLASAVTILLAWLMAATVELSSQQLGRWLAKRYLRGGLRPQVGAVVTGGLDRSSRQVQNF
jgi:peptidoglycan/LPS O-acetylase OafA/YrhL